jgi:16S rRNA (uracil1498-N3)-methyltransferase
MRAGDVVILSRTEAHYVARVLRLHAGDEVHAFDGTGRVYRLRLTDVSATTVQGQIMTSVVCPATDARPLVLGQALPKGTKMDLVVEKCSELGLTTLVPVSTTRTVVRHVAERMDEKLARWQRIAEAAARQCGRRVLLEVQPPLLLADFCRRYSAAPVKIVCWEGEQQRGLRQVLNGLAEQSPVVVLIGPEGGFTAQEIAVTQEYGFVSVNLGPHILRSETAAIAVISILRYRLGDLEPSGKGQ